MKRLILFFLYIFSHLLYAEDVISTKNLTKDVLINFLLSKDEYKKNCLYHIYQELKWKEISNIHINSNKYEGKITTCKEYANLFTKYQLPINHKKNSLYTSLGIRVVDKNEDAQKHSDALMYLEFLFGDLNSSARYKIMLIQNSFKSGAVSIGLDYNIWQDVNLYLAAYNFIPLGYEKNLQGYSITASKPIYDNYKKQIQLVAFLGAGLGGSFQDLPIYNTRILGISDHSIKLITGFDTYLKSNFKASLHWNAVTFDLTFSYVAKNWLSFSLGLIDITENVDRFTPFLEFKLGKQIY